MRLLAIDPGNEKSAAVVLSDGVPERFLTASNEDLRQFLTDVDFDHVAIEMIASYGMAVGKTVFDTCVWIGRFIEAWGGDFTLVYRGEVKMHLCRSMRAKDANVAQALRDRFGEKGTKKKPGPLYGIKGDEWAALAVAVTWWDTKWTETP